MKKRLIPAALCALAAACTSSGALYESGNPPAVRMAASEILRNPSPTNLDGIPAGKVKWNYTTGLELLAIADAGRMYGIEEFTAYADRYFDTIVQPDGSVLTYRKSKYNLDHVCPGRALFGLYDRTGDARQEHGQRASSRSEPRPQTAVQEGRAPTAARRKGAGRNPGRNLVKWK